MPISWTWMTNDARQSSCHVTQFWQVRSAVSNVICHKVTTDPRTWTIWPKTFFSVGLLVVALSIETSDKRPLPVVVWASASHSIDPTYHGFIILSSVAFFLSISRCKCDGRQLQETHFSKSFGCIQTRFVWSHGALISAWPVIVHNHRQVFRWTLSSLSHRPLSFTSALILRFEAGMFGRGRSPHIWRISWRSGRKGFLWLDTTVPRLSQ